jgi:WD40 repeat protein
MLPLLLLALTAEPTPDKPTEDALPAHALARLESPPFYTGVSRGPYAVSPDGRHFLALGDGVVWSTVNGRQEYRIPARAAMCCAYSPDGRTVAVGLAGPGKTWIILIDAATGREITKLDGHIRVAQFVAYASDTTLVSGDDDQLFRVWDLKTGAEVRQFPRTGENPRNGRPEGVSPDGRLLATVDYERHVVGPYGPLRVYEIATGREIAKFVMEEKDAVPSVMFAPDSRSLVVFVRSTIQRFELPSGRPAGTWESPRDGPNGPFGFACANDSVYQLKLNRADESLSAFDLAAERPAALPLRLPVCLSGRPMATDVYVAGGTFAKTIHTNAKQLQVWDIATGRPRHPPSELDFAISGAAITQDGHALMASGQSVYGWGSAGKERQDWPCRTQHVAGHSTISPDGRMFANGGGFVGDQRPFKSQIEVHVWDTANGKRMAYFNSEGVGRNFPFAFSPDGRYLAEPSWQNLRVWDLASNRQMWEKPLRTSTYTAAVFTPSGRTLITGDALGAIREWDVVTGKEIRTFEGHPTFVTPPGQPGWEPYPPGHVGVVSCLAVTSDGRRLVSVATGPTTDRTIRVWELTTGKECALLERAPVPRKPYPYPSPHYPLTISPDGSVVAAPGQDTDRRHLIDLWDLRAGKRVATLDGHRGAVTALAFSPDGRRLISGDVDALGYVWQAPSLPRSPEPELDEARIAALWADLADADAVKAYRASAAWVVAPEAAVAAFRKLLPPEKAVDDGRVKRLIADLNSEQSAVRDRASKELKELGPAAARQLRAMLAGTQSPEAKRRIDAALANVPDEDLRAIRVVEVLEAIRTVAARALLEQWAKGDASALSAREASSALSRLGRR